MSGLSLTLIVCFFYPIVPFRYGQVSGVKVWLAKKLSGIEILRETERRENFYCEATQSGNVSSPAVLDSPHSWSLTR